MRFIIGFDSTAKTEEILNGDPRVELGDILQGSLFFLKYFFLDKVKCDSKLYSKLLYIK